MRKIEGVEMIKTAYIILGVEWLLIIGVILIHII